MLYFVWLKGSAVHVSKALEKDSASRSAGKGEKQLVTLIINHSDKEINSAVKWELTGSRFCFLIL